VAYLCLVRCYENRDSWHKITRSFWRRFPISTTLKWISTVAPPRRMAALLSMPGCAAECSAVDGEAATARARGIVKIHRGSGAALRSLRHGRQQTHKDLTRRCSEPRAALRSTSYVFTIHPLTAWRSSQGSRSLILCLVLDRRACARPLLAACRSDPDNLVEGIFASFTGEFHVKGFPHPDLPLHLTE
jgi:hypothetical protein